MEKRGEKGRRDRGRGRRGGEERRERETSNCIVLNVSTSLPAIVKSGKPKCKTWNEGKV